MIPQLCLIVPVYRHAATAVRLMNSLRAYGLPVFLVDDGNTAEDAAILARSGAEHAFVTVVRRHENGGKGAAVIDGLRAAAMAGHSHALQIDADGQHDIADIPRFIEATRRNPDALIAGVPQFDATAPLGRRVGRVISRVCVWAETLSLDIADPMCGFRVYPIAATLRAAESRWLGMRMDFDIEILVRLHWLGVPFRSIRTAVIYPQGGISNFRMLKDNVRISAMHTRLLLGMAGRLATGHFLRRGKVA